ncbi:hypothetical protein FACS1894110_09740 [Spirochaetia bacterium]|nr:hypothetical protein FACS1894110_09740 [Spirochaetia bacterium]
MKLTADMKMCILKIDGIASVRISNNVRTLKYGDRRVSEVIRSIPGGKPYDPHTFPKGVWNVTAVERIEKFHFNEKDYGTVRIRTDANQNVKIWELDKDGDYLRETNLETSDSGYLLHYSAYSTTLGCIRFTSQDEAELIAGIVEKTLENEDVILEVV